MRKLATKSRVRANSLVSQVDALMNMCGYTKEKQGRNAGNSCDYFYSFQLDYVRFSLVTIFGKGPNPTYRVCYWGAPFTVIKDALCLDLHTSFVRDCQAAEMVAILTRIIELGHEAAVPLTHIAPAMDLLRQCGSTRRDEATFVQLLQLVAITSIPHDMLLQLLESKLSMHEIANYAAMHPSLVRDLLNLTDADEDEEN